jgi:hypothetical protein
VSGDGQLLTIKVDFFEVKKLLEGLLRLEFKKAISVPGLLWDGNFGDTWSKRFKLFNNLLV